MKTKKLIKILLMLLCIAVSINPVMSQWDATGINPWIGATPTYAASNPLLTLNNTLGTGTAGLSFVTGATQNALFGYNKGADQFEMDKTLNIQGKDAIHYNGSRLVWGESSVTNYFPQLVGIGEDSPAALLHLNGGSNTYLRLESDINHYIDFYKASTRVGYLSMLGLHMGLINSQATGEMNVVSDGNGNYLSQSGDLRFNTVNHSENKMIIKNNGLVGIGTESPDSKLEVNGVIDISSSTTNTALKIDGLEAIWRSEASNYFSWGFGGEHNFFFDEVRIGGSGSAAPMYQLEVVGDADITGELTAASDMRLKEDIVDVKDAINTIQKLKPKSYQFKTEEFPTMDLAEGTKMGFLAQELEAVLPELVSTGAEVSSTLGESFNSKSVNYIELIPLLTKAIQEQQEMIENLKKEVQELKNK